MKMVPILIIAGALISCGQPAAEIPETQEISETVETPDNTQPEDPDSEADRIMFKLGEEITIIEFNIEKGMAADKENGFDNFVAWVKEQDPDVLLLCECNEFNDKSLKELAMRWGHPYVAVTIDDGWNPAITSRYPLEKVKKYTRGFVHGAVRANIMGVNFLCLHSCASWFDTNNWYGGSEKDYDGNGYINTFDYRLAELQNLFDNTIFKEPQNRYWILSGDLNAVSPTEARWWNNGESYWVEHKYIQSLDYWNDIMREQHPDNPLFTYARDHRWDEDRMAKTAENPRQMNYERLDYFYLSPAISVYAKESAVISDSFTDSNSDHRPIVLKLKF